MQTICIWGGLFRFLDFHHPCDSFSLVEGNAGTVLISHFIPSMDRPKNYAILTDNGSSTRELVQALLSNRPIAGLSGLEHLKGLLFSRSEVERYMEEEERHDIKILARERNQALRTMSSGEQKKALLDHILRKDPDYLILVNPFDNLDLKTQSELRKDLIAIGSSKMLVQFISRLEDMLPGTNGFFFLQADRLHQYPTFEELEKDRKKPHSSFTGTLPPPIHAEEAAIGALVHFDGVSVGFDGRPVLEQIHWEVRAGEFWQLIGPNGSGKSTLLSMITGDSHKGYGQKLFLFGQKKGSGESVWDLKKKIGYFAPAATDGFRGYHNLEHMVISGLHDSIGLYVIPSDTERKLAQDWLSLLGLLDQREMYFRDLSPGVKRLVMLARAMVKHPPLLILDEPTAGLDDSSASLLIAMVNKIAKESNTAIIFVSHRKEPGLNARMLYILEPGQNGSRGRAVKNK